MSQQLHPTFMPFMQAAIQKQWQPTLSALVDQKQKHDAKSPEAHHYIRQPKNSWVSYFCLENVPDVYLSYVHEFFALLQKTVQIVL